MYKHDTLSIQFNPEECTSFSVNLVKIVRIVHIGKAVTINFGKNQNGSTLLANAL